MIEIAKSAGCSQFLQDMSAHGITSNLFSLHELLNSTIKVFCPADKPYSTYKRTHNLSKQELAQVILDHVTHGLGTSGAMFESLSKRSKVMTRKHVRKVSLLNIFFPLD